MRWSVQEQPQCIARLRTMNNKGRSGPTHLSTSSRMVSSWQQVRSLMGWYSHCPDRRQPLQEARSSHKASGAWLGAGGVVGTPYRPWAASQAEASAPDAAAGSPAAPVRGGHLSISAW